MPGLFLYHHRKAGKKGSDGSPDIPPKRTIIRVAPVTAKG